MDTQREELRDHLVAALEAAPELPREDRRFLADGFLEELQARYELVPRGQGRRGAAGRGEREVAARRRPWWPALVAGFLLVVTLLWLTAAAVGAHHGHGFPPIFLVPLLYFFVIRRFSRRWAGWRQV